MADLNINSKYRMLSGYDIPALGYGVSRLRFFNGVFLSQDIYTIIFKVGQSLMASFNDEIRPTC